MKLATILRMRFALLFALSFSLTAVAVTKEFCESTEPYRAHTEPTTIRDLRTIQTMRIGTFNVENLVRYVGKYEWKRDSAGNLERIQVVSSSEKPEDKIQGVADMMNRINYDFAVINEVDGLKSLTDFETTRLKHDYDVYLVEGNDTRGIDIGFIIKKDLNLKVQVITNKDVMGVEPVTNESVKIFSRDLPYYHVRERTKTDSDPPLFTVVGVHMKSKRDRENDPRSHEYRKFQMESTARLIKELRQKYGEKHPIFMMGDFNGDLNARSDGKTQKNEIDEAAEFNPLWAIDLINSFDVPARKTGKLVPIEERTSQTYHPREMPNESNGLSEPRDLPTVYNQLDGILLPANLRSLILETKVEKYLDANGKPIPYPKTYKDRSQLPSDHHPVWADIDFAALRKLNQP
jgi:hypothetical protein